MKPTCLCSSLLRLSASWSWLSSSKSGAAGAASATGAANAAGARLAGCVCDTEPCNKHSVDIRAKKNKKILGHFHMACSSTPSSKGVKTLSLDSTAGLGCFSEDWGKEENRLWLLVKQDS